MRKKIVLFVLIFASLALGREAFSQNSSTRWSELTAQSFIKRFPDPDSICWRPRTNHFSWQAGYIMFAMEKMWKKTGDPAYFNYIRKYVDQQVDEKGNIIPCNSDNSIF